jgi:hypothetical protein
MIWVSVKEELPPLDQFVNVRKSYTTLKKVRLKKVTDEHFREGFIYEWKYRSGLTASVLTNDDEWVFIEKPEET